MKSSSLITLILLNYINHNNALENLKSDWTPFINKLIIPEIIDLRNGGNIDMEINKLNHNWGNNLSGNTYGYGILNKQISYPGPTILVSKDIPITITWHNKLTLPHILDKNIENSLLVEQSACYPNCGIPTSVHIHGLESAPANDGIFTHSIYSNKILSSTYLNIQGASTKLYHDHSLGLSRLNVWAGLVGTYIITDNQFDKEHNINIDQDIPLIIQDKLIDNFGQLLYSDDICVDTPNTKWVPESFGSVNLVNGIVLPYLEIKPTLTRFRIINGANARHYTLNIPFYNKCTLIATDSGYVQNIELLTQNFVLFPFERIEVICDFTNMENQEFIIMDTNTGEFEPYNEQIMKIKITNDKILNTNKNIKPILNNYKNFKAMWEKTKGLTKNITLGEMLGPNCPIESLLQDNANNININSITHTLSCIKGTVEKWTFRNPTADTHPFHWHVVNAVCGNDENSINNNRIKDTVQIPNDPNGNPTVITQICYVACTPEKFLYTNSVSDPNDFKFNTDEAYVAHCHILEHEENSMMSWFKLINSDTYHTNNNDNEYHIMQNTNLNYNQTEKKHLRSNNRSLHHKKIEY